MKTTDGLLADRYRLDTLIAVGGMGEVWRAQDVLLDRVVAVKTLKPEYVGDEDFRARFRAEARHAAGLSHPGIASVYDFGESTERAWLVMELVDGEPLSAQLRRDGALSPDRTLDVVTQTAAALQVAHDGGVVHRDVKPGNLMVRPDGAIKVTDFGIASAADAVPLTRTGQVVGTAYYLSPEQASGHGAVPASDLYSLGVVAYECLTGVRPFPGENAVSVAMAHLHAEPPPLPSSVPAPLAALLMRLLAKDPVQRPASAGQLSVEAAALRTALRDGHTLVLPAIPSGGASPADAAPAESPTSLLASLRTHRPTTGPRRQPHRRAVRSAAILLAVLALGLGLRAAFAQEQVLVPAFVAGVTEQQARTELEATGLEGRTVATTSVDVPAGNVVSVEPGPGREVDAGSDVILVVSTGPPPVTVSATDIVGQGAEQVRDALAARGLDPQLTYDGSGTPVGTVSAVDPVGELPVGTPVVLHVVPAPPDDDDEDDKRDDDDEDDKERGRGRD